MCIITSLTCPGYRRTADDHGFQAAGIDGLFFDSFNPEFLAVGGNTGKVNSFTGVNPGDLSGGVFTAGNLREGNNVWCFAMQFAAGEAPDLLKPIFSNFQKQVSLLDAATTKAMKGLGCPQLSKIDKSQFKKFPGSSKLKTDGTY